MYTLVLDRTAQAFLETLPKELAHRIWNKLISAKENPNHYFKRLAERKAYKLRIEDYRIIADINEEEKRIEVLMIGHRKNVYKNI
jgi:mRNA interferase RelE/StbE